MQRKMMYRTWVIGVAVILLCRALNGAEVEGSPLNSGGPTVFPVNEKLSYAISYLGVHCGHLQITSFIDGETEGQPIYRIVALTRTTKFFDGIYRLRSRLDSFFDPHRMTSLRYEEHSREKKKQKEEIWDVDEDAKEVVRTKNGEVSRIPVEVDRAYDPLAFIYRLRSMDLDVGDEDSLNLMTSKGTMETIVKATRAKKIRTKMGKCEAVAIVPEPRDKMMFSKSGSMVVWIDRAKPNRPCKIEFKLSFGTLVASLAGFDEASVDSIESDWETWSGPKEEKR